MPKFPKVPSKSAHNFVKSGQNRLQVTTCKHQKVSHNTLKIIALYRLVISASQPKRLVASTGETNAHQGFETCLAFSLHVYNASFTLPTFRGEKVSGTASKMMLRVVRKQTCEIGERVNSTTLIQLSKENNNPNWDYIIILCALASY